MTTPSLQPVASLTTQGTETELREKTDQDQNQIEFEFKKELEPSRAQIANEFEAASAFWLGNEGATFAGAGARRCTSGNEARRRADRHSDRWLLIPIRPAEGGSHFRGNTRRLRPKHGPVFPTRPGQVGSRHFRVTSGRSA